MTLPVWPAELPQFAERKGFSNVSDDAAWAFKPDRGEPVGGRASTDAFKYLIAVYSFEWEQVDAFWDFWDVDINAGTEKFTFPHPWTRADLVVRFADFTKPPEFRLIGFQRHEAQLYLRILPA